MRGLFFGASVALFLLAASATNAAGMNWSRSWAAAPQAPTVAIAPMPDTPAFDDQTIRQVVRLSAGGEQVRVRLTNEFGVDPITIGAAHLAIPMGKGSIQPGSDHVLTFGGKTSAVIRPGAPLVSDPVNLSVAALSSLSISIYVRGEANACTCHSIGMQTGYVVKGDQTGSVALEGAENIRQRPFLSAVEVGGAESARTIVIIGDSITDGVGSTIDANRRWPDLLAERLAARSGARIGVANAGISGNRVVSDRIGASAVARFDRDVLAVPGVAYVIVFEGINDIGFAHGPPVAGPMAAFMRTVGPPVSADDMIAAYQQMIARAHAQGVKIIGATIAPYEGASYASAEGERQRQAVNTWIRTSGAFDAVLDFDAVLRDPAHPTRVLDAYHSGDHLHGSDRGYQALADSIDLSLFD